MGCSPDMSFQLADCDPPICFRAPRGAWASLATTVVSFLSSPAVFFALITKFSCLNAYCSQHCQPHLSVQLGPRRWYESAWCLLGFAGGNGFNPGGRGGVRHVSSAPRRLFSRYPRLLGSLFPRDAQFVLQPNSPARPCSFDTSGQ